METWIWILSWIFSVLIIICIVVLNIYKDIKKNTTAISFKEGLDLTELPIATFNCGNKKLHFLLDTGSNISYINQDVLTEIEYSITGNCSKVVGMEGNAAEINHYLIKIGYKDNIFEEEFGAANLTNAFQAINKESGVELHGILGSKFFEKYKYILDFKELTAYR